MKQNHSGTLKETQTNYLSSYSPREEGSDGGSTGRGKKKEWKVVAIGRERHCEERREEEVGRDGRGEKRDERSAGAIMSCVLGVERERERERVHSHVMRCSARVQWK